MTLWHVCGWTDLQQRWVCGLVHSGNTKQMVVDLRRISLMCGANTARIIKKACQCLYFLRRLKRPGLFWPLSSGVWWKAHWYPPSLFGMGTAKWLQRVVKSAQKITTAAAASLLWRTSMSAGEEAEQHIYWRTPPTQYSNGLAPSPQARQNPEQQV